MNGFANRRRNRMCCALYCYVVLVCASGSANSTVIIHFHEAPPEYSRFTTAVFRYSVENPDVSNACINDCYSISCELDGQALRSCPPNATVLKNLTANQKHIFLLHVTTRNGERNSSSYSWSVDMIPPNARISSKENYTSAGETSIDITFTEACTRPGGFMCKNSSVCDVIVDGPAHVHTSSLRTIKANIKYRLDIVFSLKTELGRVVISLAEGFCTDNAGNSFKRTNDSVLIIRFDRRPVLVDLWMAVPSYVFEINELPRTVSATNKVDDLKLFLDFSIPVKNTTEEILNALHVTSGNILPTISGNHGNRKFVFELKNVTDTEIITIELNADMIVGRTGAPVSSIAPLVILYDSTQPRVGLSTSLPSVTKAPHIKVVAEFSKPVFHFEASMVNVEGGKLTRFKELSRALYSFTVLAVTASNISISIDAGKVKDISGNQNVASNKLEVKHYSTPSISTALQSFITVGVLATSFTAAAVSLSSATLGAIGALSSVDAHSVAFNPSMNLQGLFGHLQVFVLSDWFSANHPIEYSETTKGLRWLIPRQTLPWKKEGSSMWPKHVHLAKPSFRSLHFEFLNPKKSYNEIDHLVIPANGHQQLPFPNEVDATFDLLPSNNISSKTDSFGKSLTAEEYFTYFLRGEPLTASGFAKRFENYKGWQDLEMNLFWLAVGGCSLVLIHILVLLLLRWRTGTPVHGILSIPRFELLLLILMLPCISQSSAFVIIRGGTRAGVIVGVMLLAIPTAFILSTSLFLAIAIYSGNFVQYKEMRQVVVKAPWYKKLWYFFTGRPITGKWFYREGLPSSFLPRFGIIFDSRRGPAQFVFVDQNDPSTLPKWTESSRSGIGRMRSVSLDDSIEETEISLSRRVIGCVRSSYILVDISRRVSLGIVSGAFSLQTSSQSIFALAITLLQFFYLFIFRPYIRRGVHVVECIALLCEAGLFAISAVTNTDSTGDSSLGYIMLSLLFLAFIAQLTNEWYALIQCLLCFSKPQKNSVVLGVKIAAKSLLFPFLPRRHWSGILHSSKPKTGLSSVPTLSPETGVERSSRESRPDSFIATTATVVPVLSPSPPSMYVTGTTSSTMAATPLAIQRTGEERTLKGLKVEHKRELKKLRALAKASFSGEKDEDFGSSS